MLTFINSMSLNNRFSSFQKFLYLFLFLLLLAAIIPFFMLAFYAHPGADDFAYAAAFRNGGFWGNVVGEYMGWKGRYFAIFVTVFFHQSGDMIANYKYPLLIILTLIFVAFYFLVSSLFEKKSSFAQVLYCSIAIGVFYIITLPKVSAALYWADGAFQYQVGSIMFLFSLASLFNLYRAENNTLLAFLGSAFFIFAAIGSHEIFLVVISSLVGVMFIYKFFVIKENRLYWFFVMLITIVSSSLVIYAPGNAVRMAIASENSQQFWFSIGRSLYHGGEILAGWLSHPGLWLLSILFIPVALYLVYLKEVRKDASWKRLSLIAALLTGQLWLCFFSTWWAAATPVPWRALNAIYLIFLIGWFILLFELIAVLAQCKRLVYTERFFTLPSRVILMLSTIFLCAIIVGKTHVREAFEDLSGRAQAYDKFMDARYAYIRQQVIKSSGNKTALTVGMVKDPPRILVYTDISRDRNDWRNNGYAKYFGLKSIATQ